MQMQKADCKLQTNDSRITPETCAIHVLTFQCSLYLFSYKMLLFTYKK